LTEEWNTAHHKISHVEVGQRHLFDNEGGLVRIETSSNDNEISLGGKKSITALNVQWAKNCDIYSLRVKYEDTWGNNKITGHTNDDEENEEEFNQEAGENITNVKTKFHSKWGRLSFLQVETSPGRVQQWGKKVSIGRAEFSPNGKRLGYVSCANGDRYYQTVFHWI
jgi:hypothetical protein